MKYLAVLGRQAEISLAELSALFNNVKQISHGLALIEGDSVNINRLGGCLKIAEMLQISPLEYLRELPDGKITIGMSDYSRGASKKTATFEALKLKKILVRHGRSVRVVENKEAILSTAASLHNNLSGKNPRKVEFIKFNGSWFKVIGVQNIDAYAQRDQKRPARDARVGMLPPKLAQILINLCGNLPNNARILDPFCGTGVILQEALLMNYIAYGTDINARMVEYTQKNLNWLIDNEVYLFRNYLRPAKNRESKAYLATAAKSKYIERRRFSIAEGDAMNFEWQKPINAVACEGYLGKPMSQIPAEIKLKEQKQECGAIILGFLKNLSNQIEPNTPVVIAAPAWLRKNGEYERLKIVDEIKKLGYNVSNKTREGLIYHRDKQIVARDILILRKK